MKIDREKLSTLLKSGLHPEINTRKKLAAEMGLDPTSITRWFAVRDRLGNPRYPVVPDRHVNRILDIFNAQPSWLSLENDAFRQVCFETAIEHTQKAALSEKEKAERLKRIEQRRLVIDDYTLDEQRWLSKRKGVLLVFVLVALTVLLTNRHQLPLLNDVDLIPQNENAKQREKIAAYMLPVEKCWTGFSASVGEFEEPDPADPCHYTKLLNEALVQLSVNNLPNQPTNEQQYASLNAHHDYLKFLSAKLDQRRIREKMILNIELAKSELKRNNEKAAANYLVLTKQLQQQLTTSYPHVTSEIEKMSKLLSAR